MTIKRETNRKERNVCCFLRAPPPHGTWMWYQEKGHMRAGDAASRPSLSVESDQLEVVECASSMLPPAVEDDNNNYNNNDNERLSHNNNNTCRGRYAEIGSWKTRWVRSVRNHLALCVVVTTAFQKWVHGTHLCLPSVLKTRSVNFFTFTMYDSFFMMNNIRKIKSQVHKNVFEYSYFVDKSLISYYRVNL